MLVAYVGERLAPMQDRLGPNRVGAMGSLQWVADGIKLILKEIIIPRRADRTFFLLAPIIVVFPFILTYTVIPFSPTGIRRGS